MDRAIPLVSQVNGLVMGDILSLQNIHKHFGGVHAVRDVSFSIERGEVCALIGENGAGKSTVGKIIAGIYRPDHGQLVFEDESLFSYTPLEAQSRGISLILQELDLFPSLSIAMNIVINNIHFKYLEKGLIRPRIINREVKPWLEKVGINLDPSIPVEALSMAQVQLVAIARVLSMNTRLIIMDEPTSSLTDDAVANLFDLIAELKHDGVTIIFVSHKMNEIFRIADSIVVMRDGCFIGKMLARDTDHDEVIEMMVGRLLSGKERQQSWKTNDFILSVDNLSTLRIKDVSFNLYAGEVLGVAGLVGAGRSELGEALFGMDKKIHGHVTLDGTLVDVRSPGGAIRHGFGLIPEDRKIQGLMMQLSVKENMILSRLDQLNKYGFLVNWKIQESVNELVESIKIKTSSIDAIVDTLSGGNQQKVLVSRWLMVDPNVLFLDDPTRGVDVGAKEDIYEIITSLASKGKGIIFVSSELPELLRCSDRILVMSEGNVVKILNTEETTQKEIMFYATRVLQ